MEFADFLAEEMKQIRNRASGRSPRKPDMPWSPGKYSNDNRTGNYRDAVDRDTATFVRRIGGGGDGDYREGARRAMAARATSRRGRSLANSYMTESESGKYGDDYAGISSLRRYRVSGPKLGKRIRRAAAGKLLGRRGAGRTTKLSTY